MALYIVNSRYTDTGLTPSAIANSMGVRLASLCASFQASAHCTLRDYIRDVRLNHAVSRLATANLTIKEIWASLGYSQASSFHRDFKRRFGCSPKEYRSRIIRPVAHEMATRAEHVETGTTDRLDRHTRVLIVDENDGIRRVLSSYLQSQGFSVTVASTDEAGLYLVDQTSPDVVLLDYHLDEMNGFEFVRKLRRNAHGKNCAVAIFTSDWNLEPEFEELDDLDCVLASKLCALQSVRDIVLYLMRREQGVPISESRAFETQHRKVL
jgi:AraC-like DNA-binding protein